MEKYRQFAHPGTGINPFIPPNVHRKPGTWEKVIFIVTLPLNLVRAVLLLIACTLWNVLDRLPLREYPVSLLTNAMLYLIGFSRVASIQPDSRKLRVMLPNDNKTSDYVIISQYQSACDILVFSARVAPVYFGFIASDGKVKLARSVSAFILALQPQPEIGDIPLDEFLTTKSLGVRVLFAEGARTNGTGVLAWPRGLSEIVKQKPIAHSSIKYSTSASLNHCTGDGWEFIKNLMYYWGYSAESVILPPVVSDDPRGLFVRVASTGRADPVADTNLTAATARDFEKFWNLTQGQYKID